MSGAEKFTSWDITSFPDREMPSSLFKLNQDGRRHLSRQRHKMTKWPAHDAILHQRGSLTA